MSATEHGTGDNAAKAAASPSGGTESQTRPVTPPATMERRQALHGPGRPPSDMLHPRVTLARLCGVADDVDGNALASAAVETITALRTEIESRARAAANRARAFRASRPGERRGERRIVCGGHGVSSVDDLRLAVVTAVPLESEV
jgi:hypothetical protein